jgi:hypothetical protein
MNVELAYRLFRYINEGPFIFKDCDYYNNKTPILYFVGFKIIVTSENSIIVEKTLGNFDKELLLEGLEKMVDNVSYIE